MKIFFLSVILFVSSIVAAPHSPDTIFILENTTWGKGTIQCDSSIVVNAGVTLTIAAGARCLFSPGVPLICRGRLIAKGSPTDTIFFAPALPLQYWGGITLSGNGADSSVLDYCNITYAAKPHGGGLTSIEAETYVSNSFFSNDSAGYDGGAIYLADDILHICSTTITLNKAVQGYGGGIFCRGRLEMENCQITSNVSLGNFGGGVMVFDYCSVKKCTFISNTAGSAGFGGGLICQTDTAIIVGNNFSQNSASNGGALYSKNYTEIENNTFTSNTALEPIGIGGAISCNGTTIIKGNIVSSNIADSGVGGGLYVTGQSVLLQSNIIQSNLAYLSGGGVHINTVSSKILNNSVVNNKTVLPESFGGGIVLGTKTELFVNNTIANNEADTGGGVYHTPGDTSVFINSILWGNNPEQINSNLFITCNYSCIQNGWQGTSVITSDPLFKDSTNGDYSIISPSQCINSGTSDTTGLSLPDQALNNLPRIIHGRVDVGAFEYDGPTGSHYTNGASKTIARPRVALHNSQLAISLKITSQQNIIIDIYSPQGVLNASVYHGILNKGLHTLTLNLGQQLHAAGVYLVRMKIGDTTVSEKVVRYK